MTPTAPRRGALATLAAAAVLGPLTVAVPGVADAVTTAPVRTAGASHELLAGQQGWVTGTVVNRHGTPIEGALVNALKPGEVPEAGPLDAPNTRQDRTADDGTFRLRQTAGPFLIQICTPEPGQEYVCKEAARGVDFMPTYVGPAGVTDSWVTQTALFASTASDRDLGTVTVKPQAFVAGRLVGAFFQPVQVQRLNGTAAWYGETDADGDYAFRGLAPGRYRIASGGPGTGFLPFLSPIVELEAREHATVDGTLDRGARIRGVVTSHGTPVPGLDVMVSRDGETVAAATTDRHGRYRVDGLETGSYTLANYAEGTRYRRSTVGAVVVDADEVVDAPLTVHKGASITVAFRKDGAPAIRARDELRDSDGHAVLGQLNETGTATYRGLAPGTYTVVAGAGSAYGKKKITVDAVRRYDAGVLRLDTPTLTLSGTTAPGAVVEAYSGNECPPDGPRRPGAFHRIKKADDAGHYVLRGLVPGRYMLGSDGWPHDFAPVCVPDVHVAADRTYDLPLEQGGTVHGRLVYAETGTPVILPLSYELAYPPGSYRNPTGEHPARSQARQATGLFTISGLPAGDVEGHLAQEADLDEINDPWFFVRYPFQDGTPYFLTSDQKSVTVTTGTDLDLGDIELTVQQ